MTDTATDLPPNLVSPEPVDSPMHWYVIVHVVMALTPAGQSLMRHFPVTMPRAKPTVPMFILSAAQEASIDQMVNQGMPRDSIKGASLISVSYLGEMTKAEFLEHLGNDEQEAITGEEPEGDEPPAPSTPKTPFDIH